MNPRAAEPFILIGESRRREVARRLSAAAADWYRHWSSGNDQPRIEIVADESSARTRAGDTCIRCTTQESEELLSLRIPPDLAATLLGQAAGSGSAGTSAATGVAGEIARSLADAFLQEAGITGAQVVQAGADISRIPRRRGVSAVVALGTRTEISLCLGQPMLERLLPRPAPFKGEPLKRRRESISHATLRVEAVLGEAEVTLTDLAGLAAGDVIVLDRPLNESGYLVDLQGQKIAGVTFGRAGAFFACSGATRPESSKR